MASSTTTGTTLSVTVPTAGVAAGTSVIVSLAMNPSAGTVSCTDTRSNSYAIDRDITNGSATTGVRAVVLSAHNVLSLASGNTITCTHPSVTARAMSANQFSGIAATAARDQTAATTGNSTAPSSGSTPTTTQAAELLVGTVGVEGPSTETFTVGASYAIMGRRGTSGGTSTNNITVNPEYRIVSASGAYNAGGTLSVAHRWAAAIVTYKAAPVPTKLVIASVNGGANPTAGTGFSAIVQAQTATGTPANVAAATAVSLSRIAGSGVLGGTTAGTIAAGTNQVTISGLTYTKAESGIVLRATRTSGDSLTAGDSAAFTVNPGAASKLAFAVHPGNSTAGGIISGPPTVVVQDSSGNTVTSSTASITIAIGTNPGGGALGGTKTNNAASGVVSFNDLTLDKAGTGYTLSATSTGLTAATSTAFNITPIAPTKLAFIVQPGDSPVGSAISGAPTVAVQDSAGNTVTTGNRAITITLGNSSNLGTLSGTKTTSASAGVASFSNLTINQPGNGYTLRATSTGLTSATSNAFAITTASNAPSLTINKVGTGTVTSNTGGINCGSNCSASFAEGAVVTLKAVPAAGWTFAGWSGHLDCYNGSLTMYADKTCTATFETTTPGFVQITSPTPGSVINSSNIIVNGALTIPPGTQVTVTANGIAAFVNANQWAAEVPLESGSQTISVVATALGGAQATDAVTVNVTQVPTPLRLRAVPASGVAPLTITLNVDNQTGRSLVQIELDETGSGTFGQPIPPFTEARIIYPDPNLHFPTIRATDDQGTTYTAMAIVNAESVTDATNRFRSLWTGFKSRLQARDISGALAFLAPDLQPRLESVFQQLDPDLPVIADGFGDLEVLGQSDDLAETAIVQEENGTQMLYFIYFRRDSLGRWVIEEM